ncbi:hypothetical protein LTR97_002412 [Elasticomyces elasticus]|uniref:Acyl-coenzyme A oxidase n=1 Tax=Elasticomyces elasticus TaxID=574655 RepID=A0AAN7ZQ50_9PEZI|nr:hypothetical protein LTR97_002412 [Elasticomyces elasticus]KAK5714578.1 hypothetical protein LTR15_010760 [Elasticomyces elasticus]
MASPSLNRNIPINPIDTPFSVFLWGGRVKFDRRRDIHQELSSNPIFSKTSVVLPSIARKDAWIRAAYQARELIRLKLERGWSHTHFREAIRMTDNMLPVQPQQVSVRHIMLTLADFVQGMSRSFSAKPLSDLSHDTRNEMCLFGHFDSSSFECFRIFMSNLDRQMSDEQKAIWIPKAERFEIFGSYAQTELGHGSNVRDLETTATFDKQTDEFVIDSPTLSSTKYWIGATGVWATHSIVVAKLLIDGKNHGNHLFLTQIRELDTQRLMPGVEIYELGPKAFQGMLGTDNGALTFHNVRVPRSQMLARNAQVLRDGTYIDPKNQKHSYGSMITVRAIMAEITGWDLLKAVAVCYHYTRYRKQFRKDKNQQIETTVIDYTSVKQRLIPLLAKGTALVLVGQNVTRGYDEYTANNLKTGDFSQLEDFHLQTVGAKVYSTEITSHGVETCRIACGGHGYHALSGFGRMYANTANALTYEGDNYVIGQQVPRAILKHYKNKTEGSLPSLSYLAKIRQGESSSPTIDSEIDWLKLEVQQWALEKRLANMVQAHIEDTAAGKDTSYTCHALTMAHSDFVYWRGFRDLLQPLQQEKPAFLDQITALFRVFSLSILHNPHHPSMAQALPLSYTQQRSLRAAHDAAVEELATNHLTGIIEAYGFTSYEMDSALARADRTPYEALFEEGAKSSEMSGDKMKHLFEMMVDTRQLWKRIEAAKAQKGDMQAKL